MLGLQENVQISTKQENESQWFKCGTTEEKQEQNSEMSQKMLEGVFSVWGLWRPPLQPKALFHSKTIRKIIALPLVTLHMFLNRT